MVNYIKAKRFMEEETTGKNKGVATNKIELRVKFKLKNSKAQLGEIEVVVHVNKMSCPKLEN